MLETKPHPHPHLNQLPVLSLERCSIQINTIMTVIALRQYLNTDGSRTHSTKHYGAWEGWYLSWLHLNFSRNLGHNL